MALGSFNHWAKLAAALKPACAEVVKETAFDCQDAIAAQISANGQIDTGFMYSSVYNRTADGSTYGQTGTPPGDSYLLPEVEAPANDQEAYFAVAANYGIFQNYGTRFLPARPFFEPGVERVRPEFDAKVATMEDRIKARI